MDSILGLPAHPLLVHLPVAMLPLAAAGVLVMLVRQSWYERYRWAVLFVGGVGTIGAIVATSTGEGLEKQLRDLEGAAAVREVHDHAQSGELARTLAIVFFVSLAAYVVIPWFLERRRPAASSGTQPVSIIDAGHSGASQAWKEFDTSVAGPAN